MPDGEAAAKSAVFAMGSLVSSVFGSRVYQSLSGPMQVRVVYEEEEVQEREEGEEI
jgi:hypothetical protein